MSGLPSKYSDAGLSKQDQQRILTVGSPRQNRPIGAIKIEERVSDALVHLTENSDSLNRDDVHYAHDPEGDIPMIGMDDEQEVQIVSDFVTERRNEAGFVSLSSKPIPELDDNPEVLQSRDIMMVIDTNFIISHLDIVDDLSKLYKKYHHRIVIPVTVIQELDGLKLSHKRPKDVISDITVGHLARWANDWIYRMLAARDSSVRAQKLRESIDKESTKDDAILDCCLYFKERTGSMVVLLSNDKNLCMKALANEILTVSYTKGMTAKLIAEKSFQENMEYEAAHPHSSNVPVIENGGEDIDMSDKEESQTTESIDREATIPFGDASDLVFSEIQKVVLEALDAVMYAEYEDDVELIGYDKSKVLTLGDALKVISQYWISVFTEYFKKSSFKPSKGNDNRYKYKPLTKEELEDFIRYWSGILTALYVKRDEVQNSALDKIIERWECIASTAR